MNLLNLLDNFAEGIPKASKVIVLANRHLLIAQAVSERLKASSRAFEVSVAWALQNGRYKIAPFAPASS